MSYQPPYPWKGDKWVSLPGVGKKFRPEAIGPSLTAANTLRAAAFGPPKGYKVLGSSPKHTVNTRGSETAVGIMMGGSEGLGVASAPDCGDENPQAVSIISRKLALSKVEVRKDKSLVICFEDDMAESFFEESICQLYKQAA